MITEKPHMNDLKMSACFGTPCTIGPTMEKVYIIAGPYILSWGQEDFQNSSQDDFRIPKLSPLCAIKSKWFSFLGANHNP